MVKGEISAAERQSRNEKYYKNIYIKIKGGRKTERKKQERWGKMKCEHLTDRSIQKQKKNLLPICKAGETVRASNAFTHNYIVRSSVRLLSFQEIATTPVLG